MFAQHSDCLRRKSAVGTAAVGDALTIARQLPKAGFQVLERDRDCPSNVRGSILLRRSHIHHDQRLAALEPGHQLLSGHRFKAFSCAEVGLDETLYAGQSLGRQRAQSHPEPVDDRRGEPIPHARAVPGSGHESGILQDLEVPAGVGD